MIIEEFKNKTTDIDQHSIESLVKPTIREVFA